MPDEIKDKKPDDEKIPLECWNCHEEIKGIPSGNTTNVFCEYCWARQ